MTSRAAHAFIDVYAVIEINEVGQVVDSRPFYRLARSEAFSHGSQVWTVRPELRMAIHACLGRGDTCESRRFDSRMTVAAIYPAIADVMLMAELDGLFARDE